MHLTQVARLVRSFHWFCFGRAHKNKISFVQSSFRCPNKHLPIQTSNIMKTQIFTTLFVMMVALVSIVGATETPPALRSARRDLGKGNGPPPMGTLYYEGDTSRTVVPPAAAPNTGRDNLYAFPNGGVEGQLPITGVAPGDKNYHGGQWAFYAVTFNVDPYLLTSEDAVREAETYADVTVTRVPDNDFKCPVQP